MDIGRFRDILFEKAEKAGFEEYEMYAGINRSFSVNIFRGEIEKYRKSSSGGVSFRGIKNGRTGYFYTEDISEEAADMAIRQALENAAVMSSEEREEIYAGSKSYPEIKTYDSGLEGFSDEEKIKLAKKLEKEAYAYSDKIELVTGSTVASGEGEVFICNSKGLDLNYRSGIVMAIVSVLASDGGNKKTGGEIKGSLYPSELDPHKIAEKACKEAVEQLGASSMKGYKGKVIFKNEAFTDLIQTFSSSFYAELAQKGLSLLKDKEGSIIASEAVTIVDEPLIENGYASVPFDSEGVASYNKTVVEKGVLKTLLYNLKSARKAGRSSTGNGFKASYKGSVSTSSTNFYLRKGEVSFEELVEMLGNGVVITELGGLHAGANAVTGDFSLLCHGFVVENGKITRPVEQIICAGNFFSLLKDIKTVASDLEFSISGTGSPSVLADNISVSGE